MQLSLFAQPNIKTTPTPQHGEQVGSKWVVNGEQKPEIKTLQDELEENNINLNARPDTCPRCGIKIGKNHIIVNFNKKLYDSDFLCQGCAWEIKELSESKNKQKPESCEQNISNNEQTRKHINCPYCGRYLDDKNCVCKELFEQVKDKPLHEQLRAICSHNGYWNRKECSHPANFCTNGCVNAPKIPEVGNPTTEAQPIQERILRPYCMICLTTENVRYVEKEKAHYCGPCEGVYCG